ncbi:MAG: T9SS type A sorting domain-containing protein [Saprospiraceae bacterium]|nr:T9SS type A sorting domain-containing protein [Saprospiraceae bacterium]
MKNCMVCATPCSIEMIGSVLSRTLVISLALILIALKPILAETNTLDIDTSRTVDSMALVSLYEAADGASWSDPWDLASSMGTWKGISLFGDRVTTLILKNVNLSGSIPPELGQMDKLSIIDLRENNLTGPIPAELGNMTSLRSITLFRNNISGAVPESLGQLQELQTLSAFENSLEGPLPAGLGLASKLEVVDLHDNKITGQVPSDWFGLNLLRTLNLSMNLLEGSLPGNLGDAGNLESLWLFENQLGGSVPSSMNNLVRLKNFFIHKNAFTDLPEDLSSLDSIRNFSIFENEITNLPDLSHISTWDHTNSSSGLIVRDNRLSFDDLLANRMELLTRNLSTGYQPQKTIQLDFDTIFLSKGDADQINLGFDENVTDNTYIWTKGNDTALVNQVSSWLIDSAGEDLAGTYKVVVKNATFSDLTLQTTSFVIDVSEQTTATKTMEKNALALIYPNPSSAPLLKLIASQSMQGQLTLVDQWGKLRYGKRVNLVQGSNTLDLASDHLIPGMYYVIFRQNVTSSILGKWLLLHK